MGAEKRKRSASKSPERNRADLGQNWNVETEINERLFKYKQQHPKKDTQESALSTSNVFICKRLAGAALFDSALSIIKQSSNNISNIESTQNVQEQPAILETETKLEDATLVELPIIEPIEELALPEELKIEEEEPVEEFDDMYGDIEDIQVGNNIESNELYNEEDINATDQDLTHETVDIDMEIDESNDLPIIEEVEIEIEPYTKPFYSIPYQLQVFIIHMIVQYICIQFFSCRFNRIYHLQEWLR